MLGGSRVEGELWFLVFWPQKQGDGVAFQVGMSFCRHRVSSCGRTADVGTAVRSD